MVIEFPSIKELNCLKIIYFLLTLAILCLIVKIEEPPKKSWFTYGTLCIAYLSGTFLYDLMNKGPRMLVLKSARKMRQLVYRLIEKGDLETLK